MKKFLIISLVTIMLIVSIIATNKTSVNTEYLRIHIRANSNEEIDQDIKYKIKDVFVNYITPYIVNCTSKTQAINVLNGQKSNLKSIIDSYLHTNNFNYDSNIKIIQEEFPTRVYEGITLESGYYDACIIELGSGKGDNWWCVVYPPLCFLDGENNIVYKSKIKEIINKYIK